MHARATLAVVNKRPAGTLCVFDPIISGQAAAHTVLDEADLVAFLDVRPVFPGHTLVVPRRHYATVADLPADLAGPMWEAAARVAAAQRAALGAAGTFFGLNDVISQSVPHVHLHVVPRRPKDGLKGFFWPRTRYPDEQTAAGVAASLREALADAARTPAVLAPPPAADHGAEGLQIRDAVPSDAAAVAAILAAGSLRSAEDPTDIDAYRAALEDIASGGPSRVLVAEVEGRVVGVCQLILFRHLQEKGGLCAEIESMHVENGMRSRGVGSVLLGAAVETARAAGCYRIQLTSNKARTDAHRFYARHGFEASHEGFKLYLG